LVYKQTQRKPSILLSCHQTAEQYINLVTANKYEYVEKSRYLGMTNKSKFHSHKN